MFFHYFHAEILKWEGKLLVSLRAFPLRKTL